MLFLASCPFFDVLARREYTRNLQDRHGQYLSGKAIGVRCQPGRMLAFQVVFDGVDEKDKPQPVGGAMFLLPLEALCWKPCRKLSAGKVQPWDCLSETFSVVVLETIKEMAVHVHNVGRGRYLFTVQYGRSDLADDPVQHKQSHVVRFDAGWFGAYPNNRLILNDRAMFPATVERPDFLPLGHIFSGE